MAEPLADRSRDLYAAAEERLLGIAVRQFTVGLDISGWVARKLAAFPYLCLAHRALPGCGGPPVVPGRPHRDRPSIVRQRRWS
ncbi:hypothetical protein [Streptomyces sp. NPDC088719]|uniref:hypothetical protein n=1 Tax=Streptomyces sp. NPDC088719 TaxID=3365872 RepID=UPI0038172630